MPLESGLVQEDTCRSAEVPSAGEVAGFYDEFGKRMIRDYVSGNRRVEAAVQFTIDALREGGKRVLDYGCGIGVSSFRIASEVENARVDGIDISPRNIDVARRLFQKPNLEFSVGENLRGIENSAFDAVVMIDVYEHIGRGAWPEFNRELARVLAGDGLIVMTVPSPLHQEYLRTHEPDGLQIIDETVSLQDVVELAAAVGGVITKYEWVGVWKTCQYIHVLVERAPRYESHQRASRDEKALIGRVCDKVRRLVGGDDGRNDVERRKKHVRERLGLDVV